MVSIRKTRNKLKDEGPIFVSNPVIQKTTPSSENHPRDAASYSLESDFDKTFAKRTAKPSTPASSAKKKTVKRKASTNKATTPRSSSVKKTPSSKPSSSRTTTASASGRGSISGAAVSAGTAVKGKRGKPRTKSTLRQWPAQSFLRPTKKLKRKK